MGSKLHPFTHFVEVGGVEFEIVAPTARGLLRFFGGKAPILPVEEPPPPDPALDRRSLIESADEFIAAHVLRPKLFVGRPDDAPEGAIPIDHLPQDVYNQLQDELLRLAGWTKEATEKMRPLSSAAPSSSSSTDSE